MLRKLVEEEKPEYLGVAFDLPGPTFRHQKLETYKEHRKPMPEDLRGQIPWIKEVLSAFRIPIYERPGYEADDLLGTLTRQAVGRGLEVVLVTGDKDLFQLLGPRVTVYRPTREGHERIDEKELSRLWGVPPEQVVDVMALMGDKIDAIPGVPGIGEKTAVELVRQFGSVQGLLDRLAQVPGTARREAIAKHAAQLRLSRELASLDTEVPVELDLERLKKQEPDRQALVRLFQTLEFRSLVKEWMPEAPGASAEVKPLEEDGDKMLEVIRREGKAALVLGSKPGPEEAGFPMVGLAWEEGTAWTAVGEQGLKWMKALLKEPRIRKSCPRLKETVRSLIRAGVPGEFFADLKNSWTDPCLVSYLLDPGRPSHQMETLSLDLLGESIEDPDPVRAVGLAAEAAWRLTSRLEEEIEKRDQSALLKEVEIPLSGVLARMESAGVAVDPQALEGLAKQTDRVLEGLIEKIYRQTGGEVNLNSPKQLAEVLFVKLKLPVFKRTKTGPSTDEGVLRRLSALHELPAMILEYRELFKLKSTYIDTLPLLRDPRDGRIHTSFNQTVTATGRLSSSDPNLQNIPIRTELGRQIRKAFVPSEPDQVLLAADYSQIELRILAHLSGDEQLTEAFRKGKDIHRVTAADIFNVGPESVDGQQRSVAKTINFGIVYGMSAFGLAKELGLDPDQAEEFIQRYFTRYRGVQKYLAASLEQARKLGYCVTLFNRRRYIPELNSKEIAVRQFAERTAVNAPIQGSAADLIKVAMVALDRIMAERELKSRMLLQVHDELIFEVPQRELQEMRERVREVMEAPSFLGKPVRLLVPIEVNLKEGRDWLEASH